MESRRRAGVTMASMIRLAITALLIFVTSGNALAAAKPQVRAQMLVSSKSLAGKMKAPGLVIVQVARDSTSYDRGHIPGARLLLLSKIAVSREGNDNELPALDQLKEAFESVGVSNGSQVVLYDDAQGLLAARAFFTLDYLGLGAKAALLDGGLEKWVADGNPVARDVPQVTRGRITPTPRPDLVVAYDQVRSYSSSPAGKSRVTLLDARNRQQFGPGAADGRSKAGHIPGAHNLFWMDTLESPANPVLKPADTVRASYKNAGIPDAGKVVVYCNTGMQASHAYFTLKWLGYSPVLYDGSFHDWIRHPGAPVE